MNDLKLNISLPNCGTWIYDNHLYKYLDLQCYVYEILEQLVVLDL